MSTNERSGICLCGNVSYTTTITEPKIHVCHCSICQKWSGGPAFAVACVDGYDIQGEDHVTWYESSEHGERGFCKNCGTHLFFRTKDGAYKGVMASFTHAADLTIGEHIFVDKKPFDYDFADTSPRLTEEDFLKKIGLLSDNN